MCPGTVRASVADHRAERRDPGSAGDEQELAFGRIVGKREASERSTHVQALASAQRLEVISPSSARVDLDEEFDRSRRRSYLRVRTRWSRGRGLRRSVRSRRPVRRDSGKAHRAARAGCEWTASPGGRRLRLLPLSAAPPQPSIVGQHRERGTSQPEEWSAAGRRPRRSRAVPRATRPA